MFKTSLGFCLAIVTTLSATATAQQVVTYKCANCGRLHTKVLSGSNAGSNLRVASPSATTTRVASKPVLPAGSSKANVTNQVTTKETQVVPSPNQTVEKRPSTAVVVQPAKVTTRRWNFDKANRWRRQIDPRAQAWAQEEANRLARRAYSGYLQNGHPGGNNPHARVTGTGTTFPGDTLIHTCEGDPGMTLVAEAAAVSHDGRIYGVRSWR